MVLRQSRWISGIQSSQQLCSHLLQTAIGLQTLLSAFGGSDDDEDYDDEDYEDEGEDEYEEDSEEDDLLDESDEEEENWLIPPENEGMPNIGSARP